MSIVEKIFPARASNDYRGNPIALYGFWLMMLPFVFRSIVHFLKPDSGVNSIATIITFGGSPDPNQVIYMFSSLWGSQQAIMVLLYLVVLIRYRNLLPLMYLVVLVENLFRLIVGQIHPLTPDYFLRTPPGAYATLLFPLLSVIGLTLSLRTASSAGVSADAEPVAS